MLEHENFDMFVIDEADESLIRKGTTIDDRNNRVVGFWDLLAKRTVLLSATIGMNMDDILFELFGVRKDAYLTF